VATPLLDSPVFGGLIGTVARGFTWKQHGDARLALSLLLRGWDSWAPGRRWACALGVSHVMPYINLRYLLTYLLGPGPHVVRRCHAHQCLDEASGGAEGTVATEQQFCFVLLLLLTCHTQISTIVHSVVLPTIYEKYIHKKIEANLLKSVAYKTLDIHVPFINPLLHTLFYCKATN